ncbi:hypothetical protein, partial [Rahnella victoriana]|uniref:hypothetical protein n=1 Tax=Rahnella victoriana TaxID=1510570 RepID=UPI001A955DCD
WLIKCWPGEDFLREAEQKTQKMNNKLSPTKSSPITCITKTNYSFSPNCCLFFAFFVPLRAENLHPASTLLASVLC